MKQCGIQQQVRVEDVWSALTLFAEAVGDHDLPPPAPFLPSRSRFLDVLNDAVLAEGASVLWLVGEPGSGKTSIISACTNAACPLVDIRFHAYQPITPETRVLPADSGRLVEAEALWGDLLSQLRERYFAGNLARHRVPVRNSFLNADGLRAEVLRLASVVAEGAGRPFVIAIDGLDHAARAGARGRPLLESLPLPNALPPNVRLLLGGQPHYDQYPVWLTRHAQRVPVPEISFEDVGSLLDARLADPDLRGISDDVDAVARSVAELAAGNCLTAVFAIEELRGLGSAGDAATRLAERRLGPQLDAYYEQLWRAASIPLEQRSAGAALDLAAAICIAPERVTGGLLQEAFRERGISEPEWELALRSLRPLVVEEQGGWRPLVNDVRVFLDSLRAEGAGVFSSAASRLADVLAERENPDVVVYTGLPMLLDQAGRGQERVGRFTPDWVLGAYVAGLSPNQLQRQADEVLDHAEGAAWEDLFAYARGLFALEHLTKSIEWLGVEDEQMALNAVPACMATEGRVPPGPSMQAADLLRMSQDAVVLVQAGEGSRAIALLERWLAAAPLERFWLAIQDGDRHREEVEVLGAAAAAIGEVSAATARTFLSKDALSACDGAKHFSAHLAKGAIRGAWSTRSAASWTFVLDELFLYFFPEDLIEPVESIVFTGELESLRPLLDWHRRVRDRAMAPAVELWLHVAHVVGGGPAGSLEHYLPGVADDLRSQAGQPGYDRETEAWALLAFLRGYQRRAEGQDASVAADLIAEYDANYMGRDERRAQSRKVLRIALEVGDWWARVQAGLQSRPDLVALPSRFEAIVRELVAVANGSSYDDCGAPKAAAVVFSLAVNGAGLDARDRSPWHAIVAAAVQYAAGDSLGPLRAPMLRVLREANRFDVVRAWREHWCSPEGGRLWTGYQHDDRSEVLGFFAEASGQLDDAGTAIPAIRELDRRTRIGFSGRKEGVLYLPLRWFEALSQAAPELWRELGLRLLQVSETVSRDGDNIFDSAVRGAVYRAAVAHNEQAALCLVESRRRSSLDRLLAWDELVEFLQSMSADESRPLDEIGLEALWAATAGLFVWALRDDRLVIAEMRDRLEAAAQRSEVEFRPVLAELCWQSAVSGAESGASAVPEEAGPEAEPLAPPASLSDLEDRWPGDARSSKPWADFVCLLRSSTARGDRSEVPRFFDLFLQRDFTFGFQFDGSADAAFALLPLLDERQLRSVLARALSARFARADCLLLVLACRSLAEPSASRRMLDDVLRDIESWVETSGLRALVAPTALVEPDETPASLNAWVVSELVAALDSSSYDELRAAMRGLGRAYLSKELRAEIADALARRGSQSTRQALLFVVEAAIQRDPAIWPDVRLLVEAARDSSSLETRLQGWLVECAWARATGVAEPQFVGAPDPGSDLAVVARAPVEVDLERHGHVVTADVEQATRSAIERVRRATGVAILRAEERAARERREFALAAALSPPRSARGGVRRLDPSWAEAVGRVVSQEMRPAGSMHDVPPVRIAQALLIGDEPWLATSSSRPIPNSVAVDWPGEDWFRERRNVPAAVWRSELGAILERFLYAELPPGRVVLGGIVKAFGSELDALFWHHLAASEPLLPDLWDVAWDVPRSFGWGMAEAWTTCNAPSATCRGHGGFGYVDCNFDVVPAVDLWKAAGWAVDPRDPTRWRLQDGSVVAEFERYATPSEYDYGNSHRYPSLRRWVANQSAADQLAAILGVQLSQRTLLEISRL